MYLRAIVSAFVGSVALLISLLLFTATVCGEGYVVDWYSPQCPPCMRMMPSIEALQAQGYCIKKVVVDLNKTRAPQQFVYVNGKCILHHKDYASPEELAKMCELAQPGLKEYNKLRACVSKDRQLADYLIKKLFFTR